jgi:hypothetical protein
MLDAEARSRPRDRSQLSATVTAPDTLGGCVSAVHAFAVLHLGRAS